MKYLAIAMLMMSLNAAAVTKTWRWSPVTEDTNNDPITVDYYNAYCGEDVPVKVLPPKLEYAQDLRAGVHSCYITAIANDIESQPSEIAEVTIIQAPPKRVIIIIIE